MDEPRRGVPAGDDMLGAPDLGRRLERWIAEARSSDAAAARARTRWLRTQAEESASFVGVLVDLAEHAAPVMIHGRAGRRHRGVITVVGEDFCALRTEAGLEVLLAYRGISSVRPDRDTPVAVGDRPVHAQADLAVVLSAIAADIPRILVLTTIDDEGITGELRSVGTDVVTVRLDGPAKRTAYVAIGTIAEVSVV